MIKPLPVRGVVVTSYTLVIVPAATANSCVPSAAMMSVPSWTRPASRAAPHASMNVHGGCTGRASIGYTTPVAARAAVVVVVVVVAVVGAGVHSVTAGAQAPIRTAPAAPYAPRERMSDMVKSDRFGGALPPGATVCVARPAPGHGRW